MKTHLLSKGNSSANNPQTEHITGSAYFIIVFFFALVQVLNFTGNAQGLCNQDDSVAACRRGVIFMDARISDDWGDTYAVAMTSSVTASGQGVYYSPLLISHSKIGYIAIGPCIQKQKGNFSGFQVNYETDLMRGIPKDSLYLKRVELYGFFNVSYQYNAILSANAQKEETIINQTVLNTTYLRMLEGYFGFGLRFDVTPNFKWFNSIGFGGYEMLDAPENLVHSKNALGLMFRTGLSYEFNKDAKIVKRKIICNF